MTKNKSTSGRVILNFEPEHKRKLKEKAKNESGLKLSQYIKMKMLEVLNSGK